MLVRGSEEVEVVAIIVVFPCRGEVGRCLNSISNAHIAIPRDAKEDDTVEIMYGVVSYREQPRNYINRAHLYSAWKCGGLFCEIHRFFCGSQI